GCGGRPRSRGPPRGGVGWGGRVMAGGRGGGRRGGGLAGGGTTTAQRRGGGGGVGGLVFWGVGINPGRPGAMGVVRGANLGEGTAFIGLPGNPVAVFVTFARVVRPLLLRLAGAEAEPLMPLPGRAPLPHRQRA